MNVEAFENARWSQKPQKAEFRHGAALSLIEGGPVLDIGCGDGLLLGMLKEKGLDAQGIDISDVAVQQCLKKGLKAVQGDFVSKTLPYADNSFKCVVALDVLEHVLDPGALLGEMKRVSSGTVIIGVPNFSSLPARLQTLVGKVPENNQAHKGHVYWFNWFILQELFAKHNLHLVKVKVNAPWERMLGVGALARSLAHMWPNMFGLSFIVMCESK